MNAVSIPLPLIAGLALLGWLLVSAPTIWKIIMIWRTPTTWISALSNEGRVEVVGKTGQKTLKSPIKNKPCVLWQLEVQEERRQKNRISWATVCKKSSGELFEVADETGKILVQPEGADLILSEDSFSDHLDSQKMSVLQSLGVSTTNWLGSEKKMRVYERLIAPGEEVFVIGEIKVSDGSKSIASGTAAPMVITDRSEWEVLNALYLRVGKYFAIALIVGIGAVVAIFYHK